MANIDGKILAENPDIRKIWKDIKEGVKDGVEKISNGLKKRCQPPKPKIAKAPGTTPTTTVLAEN